MDKIYRAKIKDTGEILETSSFKSCFRFAMRHAHDHLAYYADALTVLIEFTVADDVVITSDPVRKNYFFYNYINEEHIAYVCVSRTGFTIDSQSGIYEYEKEV